VPLSTCEYYYFIDSDGHINPCQYNSGVELPNGNVIGEKLLRMRCEDPDESKISVCSPPTAPSPPPPQIAVP